MAIKHSGYIEEIKYMQINSIILMDHGCTMGKFGDKNRTSSSPLLALEALVVVVWRWWWW